MRPHALVLYSQAATQLASLWGLNAVSKLDLGNVSLRAALQVCGDDRP
jgi:hypothetical protein